MADKKDLKIDVSVETTGDGGAKAAGEIKNLGAELDNSIRQLPVVGDLYAGLTNPIGGATAAATVFAVKVGEAVNLADKLQDLADQYDVSATAIQRVGNVAETSGGSIEAVAGAFNFLIKSSQEALKNGGETAAAYERLGISLEELKGKTPEEIFLRISDAVAGATDRQAAYSDVLAVAGRSAGSLFATFEKGRAEIVAAGEAFGTFANDDDVQRLAAAKDSLLALNNQTTIISGRIAAAGLELNQVVQDIGVFSTAVTVAQGILGESFDISGPAEKFKNSLRGATDSAIDFLKPFSPAAPLIKATTDLYLGLEPAAEAAADGVKKVGTAASNISPGPAAALAKEGLDPIKVAATAAAEAIREVDRANSQLESAQAKLARANSEAARAQVDLQLALGEITKEQAVNAKADIDANQRVTETLAERAKILGQLTEAQNSLAKNTEAGNTDAVTSDEARVKTLQTLLDTLDKINTAEAAANTAEQQKSLADLRKQTEEAITTEKGNQAASTNEALAAEKAITQEQNSRQSAPLQKSPIPGLNTDQPVDLLNPAKPRGLAGDLAPRGSDGFGTNPTAPVPPPVPPAAPAAPKAGQEAQGSTAAADAIAQAGEQATAAAEQLANSAKETGQKIVDALGSVESAFAARDAKIESKIAALAARISAIGG